MVHAYQKEMTFKVAIDKSSDSIIEFHVGWAHYDGQFLQLQKKTVVGLLLFFLRQALSNPTSP